MTAEQILLLALLQGLTEFLPISSSAHLILAPALFGWEDQGLAFDVAVHVGTLSAVLLYYRQDLVRMAGSWWKKVSVVHHCISTVLPLVDWLDSDSAKHDGIV